MRQAFIIMQIGNLDLDAVCEKAIVPALKSCNFDPKRVDKHTGGRLLQSEIVGFIESSEIIVADLTNERPNCYLEVGYAMGLDKFRNLILTAREDHNPDSPNYKKEGPKIHFDLSGYDILFWDPNDITKFKEELEKRIKRRLATLVPSVPSQVSPWDEEWISKHQSTAVSNWRKYTGFRFMEIRMTLSSLKLDIPQSELLSAAKNAMIRTISWPIGVVLNNEEDRPKPRTDGIVAEVNIEESRIYDYWALKKDGTFYLLRNLFEDYREQGQGRIFIDTRIIQITEALLYAVRLYSNLRVPIDSRILIRIQHGGLRDNVLTKGRSFPFVLGKCTEDPVSTEVETSLEKIESNLVDLVQEFVQPLFVVFDFFKVDRKELEDIVNNFVAGKVT